MAQNSLYPGFVKIKYSSNGHIHHQVLPVKADTHAPGEEPEFLLRDNANVVLMSTAVDAYIALIDNAFNTTDSFIVAEYWNIASVDADPVFEYAYEIGATGAAVAADIPNSQMCISLRTSAGGLLKLYLMETGFATNLKDDYPFSNSSVAAITAYLCATSTGWVVGRDGTYPISPLRMLTKVNDALRKKYVLNN